MEYWVLAVCPEGVKHYSAAEILLKYNVNVIFVATMEEAVSKIDAQNFLLVIIVSDTVAFFPGLVELRALTMIPILILTSAYSADRQKAACELGADLYIQKPATLDEHVVIGLSLIRRFIQWNVPPDIPMPEDPVNVSTDRRVVVINGVSIKLTRVEFELFHLLKRNGGKILTYDMIYEAIWGMESEGNEKNIIQCHIWKIRKKLMQIPDAPLCIKNEREVGYIFDFSPQSAT
ncbi:response regulator transcription factor [Oscillospiraceae bacterium OttesenSCG-928-G22]|nr:response regulator transcription factor [Oscillospiraceae bacterium OttesenSCG-928-G22]